MRQTGHRGKVDANQAQIVEALTKAGIKAQTLATVGKGVPDILAGFRGLNVLLELKSGPSEKLSADEVKWHESWPGQVCIVCTPEGAVDAVIEAARKAGSL